MRKDTILKIFTLPEAILKTAFLGVEQRRSKNLDDSNEPMHYRTAVFGIIVCITGILIFCLRVGMSLWIFPIFFGIYFTISLAIARYVGRIMS
jgi:hypothetical protein